MKFGKWLVVGDAIGKKVMCKCECGTQRMVVRYDLKTGKSTNCGCTRKNTMPKAAMEANRTHGRSDKTEQWIWSDMKRRCYSPGRRGYARYGGRGIKVCGRWLVGDNAMSGFSCFIADMGLRPSSDHTLDRINPNGDYLPENCRWASREQQNYNKRDTFKFVAFGDEYNLAEAEAKFDIPRGAIYQRIKTYGMSPEEAVSRPLRKN
jgi:hypothetical protein